MNSLQQLPGLDAIGCGYQTVNGQFANIDSCVGQLFDFDKIGYKEFTSAATGKTYGIPNKFVQYLDKNKRDSGFVTGNTVEDYLSKLSGSVEIGAKYAGFEGSVKSEFSETSSYSRYNSYTRLQYYTSFWRLTLEETTGNARSFLKDFVRDQIDNLEPMELYRKFGTHYVNDITVGGRCITSAVTNRLKCSDQTSFGVLLKAKFDALVASGSASTNVTNKEDLEKFNENS